MEIEITLNSKPLQLPHSMSVAELLAEQGVGTGGTAVAINGKIVRRPDWDSHILAGGEDVIIIQAAYGG